jgi:NlpC/P60 family/Bacterial dipeptidyl-peptidase Sh3 domain
VTLDKRLHAYRDDLADVRLRGQVEAVAFADAELRIVSAPLANLHRQPSATAMQLTQALMGETVRVFEEKNGWAWVQLARDDYVGYMVADALVTTPAKATHRVNVPSTLMFSTADLKSQPALPLWTGSTFNCVGEANGFLELAQGGHVFAAHCVDCDAVERDPVTVAERFLHAPYLWGGKSVTGVDCSGLVQIALQACGVTCPRDTDMQEAALGQSVEIADVKRGDLVFWKGHVGMMIDTETLLHANGHHMMVVAEQLVQAVARIAVKGGAVTSVKRFQ